ncbi:MAG TPA: Crp/Fnr family transcriptional regulator [Allosphingosinicella sp.]|jgi:CRP-like cAMP-binding protein
MVDPLATLLMKLRVRDSVSEEEERALRESVSELRDVPALKTVVRANVPLTHSTLLVSGLACRYKDLADGQRQIMELHVSGDFVDLHGFLLKRIDHHIGAMTAIQVALVPHEALQRISVEHPHLSRLLWLSTLLDAAIHREKILSIGRRSASGSIAHMLCELYYRLETVGLAADNRYQLPLTQADLADATGLTSVHVNRMLKRLRDEGMLTFRGGEVIIQDFEALKREAEFTADYLHLDRQPR